MEDFVKKACHSRLPEPSRRTHRKTIAASLSVAASPFSNRRASTGRSEVCEIWHKPPAIDKPPSNTTTVPQSIGERQSRDRRALFTLQSRFTLQTSLCLRLLPLLRLRFT